MESGSRPWRAGRAFEFRRRSLGSHLLGWWCALLAVLLASFLWAGYHTVEKSVLEAGGERAHVAAQQLAQVVARSAQARNDQLGRVAGNDAMRQYVKAPTAALLVRARALASSVAPPLPHRIAVWNAAGQRLFEVAGGEPTDGEAAVEVFPPGVRPTEVGSNALRLGANNLVFSRTVAAIVDGPGPPGGKPTSTGLLGYLVVRAVVANPRGPMSASSAEVISRLVGTDATIVMGNTHDDVWTDLTRKVPPPPVDLTEERVTEFVRADRTQHVGALVPVPTTPWAVWVEFPSRALLAPARAWLRRSAFLALACLIVGAGAIATVTARSTRPLADLARAAEDIAAGDYARRVGTQGGYEIGQLGVSFNVMAERIDKAYQALQHANDRTQFALTAARMGVWEVDLDSSEVQWSAAMAAVYGLTPETAPRTLETVLECIHPGDRALVANALATRRDYVLEFRVVWPDQTIRWVNSRVQILHENEHVSTRLLGVSVDITERKGLEDALFAEKELAEVTLHSIGDAVVRTDPAGTVTYVNAAAERLTGWAGVDAIGLPLLEVLRIVDPTTRVAAEDPSAAAMRLEKPVGPGGHSCLIRKDGSYALVEDSAAAIHDRQGRVTGAVIVFHDVSAERALAQKMARLAQFDALTGLPNRTLFDDRLTHAITHARRNGTRVAVLFVDLDRFKHINDSLGHAVGDVLLQSVTGRLLACVRAPDTVSRRGGDEFVLLLPDLDQPDAAGLVAEDIITALAEPHAIVDHVLHVTASIGISIYPDDALEADALIRSADAAMYDAKEKGRGNHQFFTAALNIRSVTRRALEGSLRKALRQHEFVLHYQPKVNLATTAIAGVEALVRWQHPTRGLLAPAEFVSIAEESGLILPIGRWVLREACRQAKAWQNQGLPPVAMAVNVSAVEFRANGFLEHVAAVLGETGLDPRYLELELTESVLMGHAEATTEVLYALKRLGVRLAIDDFGTGYSSLSYLSRFPIDTLKIDRSFVHGMTRGGHDATIIHAIIGMGRSLNQCVVAEGVETAPQLALLQHQRCSQGQGYHFSHPVAAEQLADLLRRQPPEVDAAETCVIYG